MRPSLRLDVASVLGAEAIGCEYLVTMTSGDQQESDCPIWCVNHPKDPNSPM